MAGAGGSKSSYYVVLDVARDASAEEIHAAWRKMSQAFHPSKVEKAADKSFVKEFVLAKYRDIQEAYDVLSDPAKKAVYDAGLDAGLGSDKERRDPIPKMNKKEEEPPTREIQINMLFTFSKAGSPDPGTSGRGGGGGGGPQNGRGKQRPRRRGGNPLAGINLRKFLDRDD